MPKFRYLILPVFLIGLMGAFFIGIGSIGENRKREQLKLRESMIQSIKQADEVLSKITYTVTQYHADRIADVWHNTTGVTPNGAWITFYSEKGERITISGDIQYTLDSYRYSTHTP